MDLGKGFHVVRELGRTGDGALLPLTALTAIHWVHRVWAMLVLVYCTVFGLLILGRRAVPAAVRPLGGLLLAAAWIQVGLGVGNVLFSLPLAVAAAHNAGAAALLVATLMINFAFTGSGQAGAAAVRGL
jgi:cytochrome c oxidase assembly protein subunit 15